MPGINTYMQLIYIVKQTKTLLWINNHPKNNANLKQRVCKKWKRDWPIQRIVSFFIEKKTNKQTENMEMNFIF